VYLALGGGPPSFTPDITCPALLKRAPEGEGCVRYPAITVYGNAFQAFSRAPLRASCRAAARPGAAYNPERARPAGLTRARFGPTPVRSPLLRGCCLFLGVHEMFQFPRCPPHQTCGHHRLVMGLPHSEIVGSTPARGSPTLIAAMPRPSSARSAEASTNCSSCLPWENPRHSTRGARRTHPPNGSQIGKVHRPTHRLAAARGRGAFTPES
jgi:hypothetical protein